MRRLLLSTASVFLRRSVKNSPVHLISRPDAPAYARRGDYSVGTREFLIPDRERPLKLTLWYPAQPSTDGRETATYVEGPIKFVGYARNDAKPFLDAAPYPLVVFSHGSGGTRMQSLFFTEHLASHGFVVMAVDHPGNTIFDSLLDPDSYEENRLRNYIQRPHDILRQIDFAEGLTALNGALAGMIDVNRVAVSGHSFGGYAAISAAGARLNFDALNEWCSDPVNAELEKQARGKVCYLRHHVEVFAELLKVEHIPSGVWEPIRDSRIKAVVAMAPWNAPIFGREGLVAVQVPCLIIVGSADPVTVPERDAYLFYEYLGSPCKALVILENAGHFIFVDSCSDLQLQFDLFHICSDPIWDMSRAHDLTNHMATAFLRATFHEDHQARKALAPDEVTFPGVIYRAEGL
jgi:predicted dienelactone hydrolase